MKKVFCLAVTLVAIMLTGCKDYDSDIADINNRLDEIKSNQIATIQSQINAINSSLSKLEKADADLKDYILALQKRASDLETDIEITNERIAELKQSLEGEIDTETARVIALLEAAKTDIQAELSSIYSLIANLQKKDKELENKIATLEDYVDAIISIAGFYGIPVLDLFRTSGIQPRIPVIQEKYMPDGLHPSDAGHAKIAKRLAGFLQAL